MMREKGSEGEFGELILLSTGLVTELIIKGNTMPYIAPADEISTIC